MVNKVCVSCSMSQAIPEFGASDEEAAASICTSMFFYLLLRPHSYYREVTSRQPIYPRVSKDPAKTPHIERGKIDGPQTIVSHPIVGHPSPSTLVELLVVHFALNTVSSTAQRAPPHHPCEHLLR